MHYRHVLESSEPTAANDPMLLGSILSSPLMAMLAPCSVVVVRVSTRLVINLIMFVVVIVLVFFLFVTVALLVFLLGIINLLGCCVIPFPLASTRFTNFDNTIHPPILGCSQEDRK